MIIPAIAFILFLAYSLLILYCRNAWRSIPLFHSDGSAASLKISVIIPARNEEKNIGRLLEAISKQTYPAKLTEVIVVDDHSTDRTAEIAYAFEDVRIVQLKEDNINSYKKKAIETGISKASGDLIVTTDADCVPQRDWLSEIVACRKKTNAVMVVGPVAMFNNSSMLQVFQTLDFLTLQGVTAVAVDQNFFSMCNGANLAYDRKVFSEVGGFDGIDKIASGDDLLLMHKIAKKYPGRITYLKSKAATVSTQPAKSWKEFFSQRIRWASKARFYKEKNIILVGLLVYLFNLSFLALFIGGFWSLISWIALLLLWIGKAFVEIPFVYDVAGFFGKRGLMVYFFFFQPLHISYMIIAGWLGQFGKYEWKGRRVR
jgi:biofilm PGA synthesis N-glycosyltransferase PgaC